MTHYDGPLTDNGIVDKTIKNQQLEAWLKDDDYLKKFIASIGGNVVFTNNGISNKLLEEAYQPLRAQCLSALNQFNERCKDWVSDSLNFLHSNLYGSV